MCVYVHGHLTSRPCWTMPQPLRVRVPNNHILTQNLYYNYYYPKPKYLIIGYLDPLGTLNLNGKSRLRSPRAPGSLAFRNRVTAEATTLQQRFTTCAGINQSVTNFQVLQLMEPKDLREAFTGFRVKV